MQVSNTARLVQSDHGYDPVIVSSTGWDVTHWISRASGYVVLAASTGLLLAQMF